MSPRFGTGCFQSYVPEIQRYLHPVGTVEPLELATRAPMIAGWRWDAQRRSLPRFKNGGQDEPLPTLHQARILLGGQKRSVTRQIGRGPTTFPAPRAHVWVIVRIEPCPPRTGCGSTQGGQRLHPSSNRFPGWTRVLGQPPSSILVGEREEPVLFTCSGHFTTRGKSTLDPG